MRTLIKFILLLLISLNCYGATEQDQVLVCAAEYVNLTTNTRYLTWGFAGHEEDVKSAEKSAQSVAPCSLTLSDFRVELSTAPGAGDSVAVTVRKNGVAPSLSVTISDTDTSVAVDTDEVSFSAGDLISIKIVGTGTPANSFIRCVVTSTATNSIILGASDDTLNNGAVEDTYIMSGKQWINGYLTGIETVVSTSGTLQNMYLDLDDAPGSGKSWDFTVMKNEATTALVTTVSDTNTTGNSGAATAAVVAGDRIAMRCEGTNSPTNSTETHWGIEFVPDVAGEFLFLFKSDDQPSNSTTQYGELHTGSVTSITYDSTESERYLPLNECTLKDLYVVLSVAPGGTDQWDFTVRDDGGDTALTVNISGVATTGSVSTDVTVASGSQVVMECDPTDTPANTIVSWGITGYSSPETVVVPEVPERTARSLFTIVD